MRAAISAQISAGDRALSCNFFVLLDLGLNRVLNCTSFERLSCQYDEYRHDHCTSVVVTLQHDGALGLRGCMTMQSRTCPAMSGVIRCRLLDILRLKRTGRSAKVFAIGFEVSQRLQ